jgi:hypothetical protein
MIMAALATLAMVALAVIGLIIYGTFLGTVRLIRLLPRAYRWLAYEK